MKYININPKHSLFTPEIKEGFVQGYTVVTAQRPLNGLKTWEDDSIGYGRYYAYGSLEQFENVWKFLDAAIIKITTNEDIENIIKAECFKEGIDLDELLQNNTLSELAESFELCYID
jgi:hypothetical protein